MKKDDPTKYIYTMYFIPESKLELSSDRESGAKYAEWAKEGGLPFVKATKLTYQWLRTGSINFMRHTEYAQLQPVTIRSLQKTF